MTWAEFKKAVEEYDVKDSDELFYLDLYPSEGVNVTIEEDASGERLVHIT